MDEKSPKINPTELPVFNFLRQKYEPAKGPEDATLMLTTSEIVNQIYRHTGNNNITIEVVHDFLYRNGFQEECIGDMHFVWYMKEIGW